MTLAAMMAAGCAAASPPTVGLSGSSPTLQRVLFIRGGAGTVGFLHTGSDADLSDIADLTTGQNSYGYGHLALLLNANQFEVSELIEGPKTDNRPVDLQTANLAQYAVVVFGSNNAKYSAADAQLVGDYVKAGGSVLFNSDANWGSNWHAAPDSDQTFLTQFGLTEGQDNTQTVSVHRDQFSSPTHPILAGVNAITTLGVSYCTVTGPTYHPQVLIPATTTVRNNDSPNDADHGTDRAPTAADGTLVVLQAGLGRVACFFDRDPFFNTQLDRTDADHAKLATNLFGWLAKRSG